MPVVRVPAFRIRDWDTFHDVFAQVLGFPSFYGRTMDSFIDCLTFRDAPGDAMATVNVPPGDVLALQVDGVATFRQRCPEQYDALVDAVAFVNWRRIEVGQKPLIVLAFSR